MLNPAKASSKAELLNLKALTPKNKLVGLKLSENSVTSMTKRKISNQLRL